MRVGGRGKKFDLDRLKCPVLFCLCSVVVEEPTVNKGCAQFDDKCAIFKADSRALVPEPREDT